MELHWCDSDYIINTFLKNDSYNKKLSVKNAKKRLSFHFPKPQNWLEATVDDKIKFNKFESGFSELHYIICWVWVNKFYKKTRYIPILLEYLLDSRHNSNQAAIWLARKVNLITQNEEQIISAHRCEVSGFRKRLALHCILLGKSFKDFTDEDTIRIPQLFDSTKYTAKAIQDIRIKLNYTNTIVKRNNRHSKWELLINDPCLGHLFKQYVEFLQRSDVRTKYMQNTLSSFNKLYSYLQTKNLKSLTSFNSSEFINLTEYLILQTSESTALCYIANIKRFFQWGLGETTYFPTTLDFPHSYWSSLMKKVKKARKDSDGRAFSELSLAEDIVRIIYEFTPTNEIEDLCRAFWLTIASAPARFSYILYLDAYDSIQPLPNAPNAFGIYSKLADKAGNKYGQFPILDKTGIDTIKSLQARAKNLNLKPIVNPYNNNEYVHLFQLTNPPWILEVNKIRRFFEEIVKPKLLKIYPNFEELRASAHGFRHHLLTHVALKSGDISVVQTAAGHQNELMTREYLKSRISRTSLLFRVMEKFQSKEITGKFYLRLVELLSSDKTPIDEMLKVLTTEMKIDEFIQRFGKKLNMGYCFNEKGCSNWLKCWGCINFLMTKDEIVQAIKVLGQQVINLKEMQKNCSDFSYEHPIIHNQVKTLSLIVKRLSELNLTEEQIIKMLDNYLHNKRIEEGVLYNER
ncbi:tyrosine-type recombinase/integrase [Clostridium sp. C8-1-8]|uniref:tyrosine-type recombinase/integrase n=1 Tax=Clostridium sp. C8-1-8 TaxID=2698831 RepID=UPI00136C9CD3|nr:tyrosine-type recombinase/integrase [Clostridium sp. C8-1-8]